MAEDDDGPTLRWEGFVPAYKAAGGPGADRSRHAEGGGAERDALDAGERA